MCTMTTSTVAPASPDSLAVRRRALLRRRTQQVEKMTSFRLPKETTSTLLHFHSEDEHEPENDVTTDRSSQEETGNNALHKRKTALLRKKHRMNSFRLPKDQTQGLLKQDVDLLLMDDEPEAEPVQDPVASITTTSTLSPPSTKIMNRRCRLLQTHNKKARMNSFRLPKETTKDLLQQKLDDLDSGSTHGRENQTAMPTQLMRQSSFSARTA